MTYLRLAVEPLPASSRLASLAKLMPRSEWDRLRRSVYRWAGYRCQICGREGRLHCHEVWQFNERTGHQLLRGFQALCEHCHGVKHVLFNRDRQRCDELLRHFVTVNRVTREQAERYVADALRQQQRLNSRDWIINFGNYNFHMPSLASVEQRRRFTSLTRPVMPLRS